MGEPVKSWMPQLQDFRAFIDGFDHIRPLGWPAQPDLLRNEDFEPDATQIARTAVGAWLRKDANYLKAEKCLEQSQFYESLDNESARLFARMRLVIDAGCAIGQHEISLAIARQIGADGMSPQPVTLEDRRRARELCDRLIKLIRKGINLPSKRHTSSLSWMLRNLRDELDGQLEGTHPITAPVRRDKSFEVRSFITTLAERFLESFLLPMPEAIAKIVEIVAPGETYEKTIRNICDSLEDRRKKAPGFIFLKPRPSGKAPSGS